MILLNKSIESQNIILTLTELTTIVNPVYLLVLTNDFTKIISRFLLEDNLSLNTNRYDLFDLSTASIAFLEPGSYTYSVYQSSIASYDESSLGCPIECGKAKVIDPGILVQPIIYNSEPTGYVTYKSND